MLTSDSSANNFIDTHCHLDMEQFKDDLEQTIVRATQAGVSSMVTIGIDLETSRQAVKIAQKHEQVWAAVGIHPHDADKASEEDTMAIAEISSHEKVVAYGEIGLDYTKLYAPREIQQKIFIRQVELARELNLPIIIHDREAHEDVVNILKKYAPFPAGGVMHCFSGNSHLAEQVMALGFHISIPGIVTFNKAKELQKVAATMNFTKMVIETDAPFLAPTPHRGKRNEPALIINTAKKIAELRKVGITEVAEQTTANAKELFNLK